MVSGLHYGNVCNVIFFVYIFRFRNVAKCVITRLETIGPVKITSLHDEQIIAGHVIHMEKYNLLLLFVYFYSL